MADKQYDWSSIARHPRFIEHCKRKDRFIYFWWLVGTLVYFLLLIGVGYTPELFRVKVVGRVNVAYACFLFIFVCTWGSALYYAYKADTDFDPNGQELMDELTREGKQ